MKHKNSSVEGEKEPRRLHLSTLHKAVAAVALFASAASLGNPRAPHSSAEDDMRGDKNSVVLRSDALMFLHDAPESTPTYPVSQEETRGLETYCEVADISLPGQLEYDKILKGSQTEFALPLERYKELSEQIDASTDITHIQQIMSPVLGEFGIAARYDGSFSKSFQLPVLVNRDEIGELNNYKKGMKVMLESFTVLPRDMLSFTKSVNFLNTPYLLRPAESGMKYGGFQSEPSKEITFAIQSIGVREVVHEVMHSLHAAACGTDSDSELELQYKRALEYYEKLHPIGKAAGQKVGFPSDYSRESDRELFAELATELITKGGFVSGTPEEHESAQHLREMIVERLKQALQNTRQHTNIEDFLEYMDAYSQAPPSVISPSEVMDRRISPLDATFASYKDTDEGTLVPAIIIRGSSNMPTQYVYAYFDNSSQEHVSVSISLNLMSNLSDENKSEIVSAVRTYLSKLSDSGTGRLTEGSSVRYDGEFPSQFDLEIEKPMRLKLGLTR